MALDNRLDEIRQGVLARAEKREKRYRLWIVAAGVIEVACLLAFVLLADFHDRSHLLLLVAAFLVYGTLAMGMLALGAFTQSWCLRILRAIELLEGAGRSGCQGQSTDQ